MATYRLYYLRDGRIFRALAFEAASDEEALSHVDTRREGLSTELWNRSRLVSVLAA